MPVYLVSVKKAIEILNPLKQRGDRGDIWGSDTTKTRVKECMRSGKFEKRGYSHTKCAWWKNYNHAARVAYLASNLPNDPIDIDVGIPSLGHFRLAVDDGNHRLAAHYIAGAEAILVRFSGAEDEFFYHFPDAIEIDGSV